MFFLQQVRASDGGRQPEAAAVPADNIGADGETRQAENMRVVRDRALPEVAGARRPHAKPQATKADAVRAGAGGEGSWWAAADSSGQAAQTRWEHPNSPRREGTVQPQRRVPQQGVDQHGPRPPNLGEGGARGVRN